MIWKPIKGFEDYNISTSGIIVNNESYRRLSYWNNSNRQRTVTICKDNKKYNRVVDKLLFETFGVNIYESTNKSIKLQINYNNRLINKYN